MEQLATPGSIRLTAATLRLAEGLIQVNALGPFPVKGLAEPVAVFELVGASAIRRRLQASAARGLPRLEQAMVICQEADLSLWLPKLTADLGEAYTLGGRVADALPLITQAMAQATKVTVFQALCNLPLGKAHLLAGRLEEAQALAERALVLARARQERGHEAYALRLLGEIAAQCQPLEVEPAADYYHQALTLAEGLGMCPLQAHCHRGLGTLYATTGQRRVVYRHRVVPRHGHDLLAAPGGDDAGPGGGAVTDSEAESPPDHRPYPFNIDQ